MARSPWLGVLLLSLATAAACAPSTPPAVAPEHGPVQGPIAASTSPDSSAVVAAPTRATRRTAQRTLAETDAALRLEADSAADALILDQLKAAAPVPDEENGAWERRHGGPNVGTARAVPTAPVSFDIEVESYASHERVQYYLDFFQGTARERFGIWLQRMPRYEPMIRQKLQEYGLPGDLVYLALIESGYSSHAVSRAKAVGMWQFMKGTARLYGLRVDYWVDERRDPYKATDAAARHLKDLYRMFGSHYLAAAAYNAGAGRVSRGLARMGSGGAPADDSEEELEETPDDTYFRLAGTPYLHRETRDYVPKLIAAAMIAKEPERYGFAQPEPLTEPFTWDSIEVDGGVRLAAIAALAGTTAAELRELNPQFIRQITPPGGPSWVRVPAGTGAAAAAAYAAAPPERATFRYHTVRRGETARTIARRYGVRMTDLAEANPGAIRKGRVARGHRLLIPVPVAGKARAAGATKATAKATTKAARTTSPKPASRNARRPGGRTHVVNRGDTLTEIAERYGVSVARLKAANGLRTSRIVAGSKLTIPAR